MSNSDETEPFLARWSRRKRGLTTDEPRGESAAERAEQPETKAAENPLAPAHDDEPPLDLTKLPRVEDVTADTDITAFLDRRVPAQLRNAVLNRMWSLDPTIRDSIEVAEMQWDWNTPGGAPFYELMEPGSAAGTLIADSSSAIARVIGGAPDASAAEPGPGAAPADEIPRKVDHPVNVDAAPQHEPPVHPENHGDEKRETAANSNVKAQQELATAVQKKTAPELQAGRRHGGALPA